MTRPTAGLLVLAVLLTGCAGSSGADDDRPSETGTPRALAAAVAEAVSGPAGAEASSAVALSVREGVRASDVGVELVFPGGPGDGLVVRVVATRSERPAHDDLRCDEVTASFFTGCEEETRGDGTETVLVWRAGAPESGPATVVALARRGDQVVQALAHGASLDSDLVDPRALADALVDLVADPAVGLETTPALVEQGETIGDDVWEDRPGQDEDAPAAARGSS